MVKRPDVSERNRKQKGIFDLDISKQYLEKEYLINMKSCRQIASDLDVHTSTIYFRLKYFGIKIRNLSEKQMGKLNPAFDKKQSEDFIIYRSKSHIQPSTINKLSNFELGYVVAITEGEGHFSLIKRKDNKYGFLFTPVIGITNKDLNLLKYVQSIIGAGKLNQRIMSEKYPNLIYTLQIRGIKNVFELAKQLLPYLFNKKIRAQRLIDYCGFILEKHKILDEKIKNNEAKFYLEKKIEEVNEDEKNG